MATTRQEHAMSTVATALGLTIVRPLGGGQFGACAVRDPRSDDGALLVLKAVAWPDAATRWPQGVEMATIVGNAVPGYPVPAYRGVGTIDGFTWSLQELRPGGIPDPPRAAHVHRLVELVRSHANLAPAPGGSGTALARRVREGPLPTLGDEPRTAWIAEEVSQLLDRVDGIELRDRDVWHSDYHRFNCLAVGDEVTAVFDWEGARPGDYRLDLANLAVTTSGDLSHIVDDTLREDAPPEVAALGIAWHSTRYVAFDVVHHPENLDGHVELVERSLASWWRPLL